MVLIKTELKVQGIFSETKQGIWIFIWFVYIDLSKRTTLEQGRIPFSRSIILFIYFCLQICLTDLLLYFHLFIHLQDLQFFDIEIKNSKKKN